MYLLHINSLTLKIKGTFQTKRILDLVIRGYVILYTLWHLLICTLNYVLNSNKILSYFLYSIYKHLICNKLEFHFPATFVHHKMSDFSCTFIIIYSWVSMSFRDLNIWVDNKTVRQKENIKFMGILIHLTSLHRFRS